MPYSLVLALAGALLLVALPLHIPIAIPIPIHLHALHEPMRVLIVIGLIYLAYQQLKHGWNQWLGWVLLATALVINPIVPMHGPKHLRLYLEVGAAVLLIWNVQRLSREAT